MIKEIQKQLEPLLAEHGKTTALLLSGGSDSLLLLRTLLDMKANFRCLAFDYSFSRKQRAVLDNIADRFGVMIFSYRPAATYLVGDGNDRVSMVEEYATLQGSVFPFVRDCVQDDTHCIHDETFDGQRQGAAPVGFTLYLSGVRRYDRHYTTGRAWQTPTFVSQDNVKYHAPLWHLTRKDVKQALLGFEEKVPTLDTGVLGLCMKCLTATEAVMCPRTQEMVEPHAWTPVETLTAFRQRFQLKEFRTA